jgi:hypothetical protein
MIGNHRFEVKQLDNMKKDCQTHCFSTLNHNLTAKLIKGARLVVVKDGPHCITWTRADEVNAALVDFLGKERGTSAAG